MRDGLQCEDDLVMDDQVRLVAAVEHASVVVARDIDLMFGGDRALVEFVARAVFIGAFVEAGAETGVHSHRQADDAVSQAFGCVHGR